MTIQHAAISFVAVVALAGCAATSQQQTHSARLASGNACSALVDTDQQVAALYAPGNVKKVRAIKGENASLQHTRASRASRPSFVVGAEMQVVAQPGMSEAYLQRVLSCHAAGQSAGSHPNDPLRAEGVADVSVRTSGSAYHVAVVGSSRDAGEAILQRARALRDGSTSVQVQQVSAAPATTASF